jgi:hypothetical protein
MKDDFQKATIGELKRRFADLEQRNENLNSLLELDQIELSQAKARIEELESLLNTDEYAILKVLKSSMPPAASLVLCYETGGVPVLADDLYPEFVVVRRKYEHPRR